MLVAEAVEAAGDRVKGGGGGAGAGGFVAVVVVVAAAVVADAAACPFVVDQVRALGRADMSLSTSQ